MSQDPCVDMDSMFALGCICIVDSTCMQMLMNLLSLRGQEILLQSTTWGFLRLGRSIAQIQLFPVTKIAVRPYTEREVESAWWRVKLYGKFASLPIWKSYPLANCVKRVSSKNDWKLKSFSSSSSSRAIASEWASGDFLNQTSKSRDW